MTELEQYIQSYFGLPQEDLSKISPLFQPTRLERGEYFLKTGKVCDKLSFQRSGQIRVYIETGKKDITQWVSTRGYFLTDLSGIIFDRPSKYHIQALVDCELYTIHKDDYNQLGSLITKWHELEKLFITHCFTLLEDRIFALLSKSAEQRYELLFEQQRDLFNIVPLQYLASMMGMTPETLSRLRRKKILG